ncbi:NAD(P)-linked oxidoreductase superfamily protein [Artemisia annua]|uniref:NAD(P)-linked oxidoreductase superfamily protein n=1 Tax=Artemisia annua TaxID=35608 RepID=A0A2U1QM72_ARTAN|nr:NAD(P)-linked oxidoreductase superfamily protein [Artemisia annua]
MASLTSSTITHPFLSNNNSNLLISSNHVVSISFPGTRKMVGKKKKNYGATITAMAQPQRSAMQYNQLGDSNLVVSEITFGTMTFGEQNTEKEAHEMLSYAVEHGINTLDTAEMYPIPTKKETQGLTDTYIGSWLKSRPRDEIILATKVSGYTDRLTYVRDNAPEVLRVDAANIKESVEKSLKRLNTDYIDLLQIHWPDRYVALFGEFFYDPTKWRQSVPFAEQLRAFQELIDEGKVRYIGVSNETSYGVMEFINAAKSEGLPKIVSIQNSYSLLARCKFEGNLSCHAIVLLERGKMVNYMVSSPSLFLLDISFIRKSILVYIICIRKANL